MQVSFRTIQLTDGKKRVNGALRARAAVRPALRQGSAFLLGLAGGWAVLYGALMPFGLGLTLGFAEDCFAVGAAGAALGVLARSFGTLTVESVCLLCALGAAVAARWLWPGRFVPAVAAGCGTLVGSAVCFAAGEENGVQTILFCGGDALLAAAAGYGLRRFPPEKPGMGSLILSAAVAAALGGMSFGFFLPGVMACAAAELALCCKGLPLEALAFSGVTGAALAASDPALAPAAAGLACGCAAAAVLAPARRVEGLAAYAGGCVAGVLCIQPLAGAFSFLLSAGAGAGLCALLPAGWLMPALKEDDPPGNERPRLSAAATRLEAVAESLSSLAETVNEVYDAFPRRCEGFPLGHRQHPRRPLRQLRTAGSLLEAGARIHPRRNGGSAPHSGRKRPSGSGTSARSAGAVHPPGGALRGGGQGVCTLPQPPGGPRPLRGHADGPY